MKTTQAKNLSRHIILSGMVLIGAVLLCSISPAKAFAGLILDAELRFTYEDNVVGLLSDQQRGQSASSGSGMPVQNKASSMGRGPNMGNGYPSSAPGSTASTADFYTTLSAEAGAYTDLGTEMSVYAKGFANHSSYDSNTYLDATIYGASTGAVVSLGNGVTALASVLGKIKEFDDSQRNSTAYGGTLSLKEKITGDYWLRQFGEYELNSASSNSFSYTGTKIGVSAGHDFTKATSAAIGYSYLVQKYDEPAGTVWRTHTGFVSAEQKFGKSWSVGAEYDLQLSRDNMTNAGITDNIFSLALRYSY